VAYVDEANGTKATVMKYDGSSWVPVGTGILSVGETKFTSLAFNNGVLYVAFGDQANEGKATVMKYTFGESDLEVVDTLDSFRSTGPFVPEITTHITTTLDLSPEPTVKGLVATANLCTITHITVLAVAYFAPFVKEPKRIRFVKSFLPNL